VILNKIKYLYRNKKNMYKNFNLTESEKEQILSLHKTHGYKAPSKPLINEQEMGDYEIDSHIMAIPEYFIVRVSKPGNENEDGDEFGYDFHVTMLDENDYGIELQDYNETEIDENEVQQMSNLIREMIFSGKIKLPALFSYRLGSPEEAKGEF
jgi:hypothetical protein